MHVDVDKKFDTLNSDKFFKNFKIFGQIYLKIAGSSAGVPLVEQQ